MEIGGERVSGRPGWRVPCRPFDYCQRAAATAALFCLVDSAFLCHGCDGEIHRANKLASRHQHVRLCEVCEVCEQAPAAVTCRADAASLCSAWDAGIHSVNPLARRHHRLSIEPLLNEPSDTGSEPVPKSSNALRRGASPMSLLFPSLPDDAGVPGNASVGEMVKPVDAFFIDPCFDLDFGNSDGLKGSGADRQVPVQAKADSDPVDLPPAKCLHMDFGRPAKPASFRFPAQSFTQTVSPSSQDFGVVPDGTDVSNPDDSCMSGGLAETIHSKTQINIQATQLSGVDREARVLRYKEKRKNRKFEKTIRYASRKAYAETRPRIKGRFVKRSAVEGQLVDSMYGACPSVFFADAEFGVAPTF